MTNANSHDLFLDASGLLCPEPIMMLHNAVRDVESGQIIKMLSTDPSTQRDIVRFCDFLGHELLESRVAEGSYYFWLRKSD